MVFAEETPLIKKKNQCLSQNVFLALSVLYNRGVNFECNDFMTEIKVYRIFKWCRIVTQLDLHFTNWDLIWRHPVFESRELYN